MPIFLLHCLIRIFGHQSIILRLPSLIYSLTSLYLLNAVLAALFSDRLPRLTPLLLFSFSVPAIVYSQSIQPIINYFLATIIQTYCFVKIIKNDDNFSLGKINRNVGLLSGMSLIAFLFSWMCILIHVIFLLYYTLFVILKSKRDFFRRSVIIIGIGVVYFIPLGVLAYLRFGMGGHRVIHEVGSIKNLFILSYDFLVYHFNYAYDPALYRPLGPNPASLPFVALFIAGLVYFIFTRKSQRFPAAFAIVAFLGAVYFNLMPFGGVRHSLAVAPFVFIFSGYGVEALRRLTNCLNLPQALCRGIVAILLALMLLSFLHSGLNLYDKRVTTLNLSRIIESAIENNVSDIVGFVDTFRILAIWNSTEGRKLEKHGLKLKDYRPAFNENLKKKYLLVSYRSAFNADFAGKVKWPADIPSYQFTRVKVTPIEEIIGPLKPEMEIGSYHQSIYYPINGSFLYLIEPIEERPEEKE